MVQIWTWQETCIYFRKLLKANIKHKVEKWLHFIYQKVMDKNMLDNVVDSFLDAVRENYCKELYVTKISESTKN